MLITEPPHDLYNFDSALVLNCGPSIQIKVKSSPLLVLALLWKVGISLPSCWSKKPFVSKLSAMSLFNLRSNGSPNIAWATNPFSKKVDGLIPLVLSITCVGMTKSLGLISGCNDPTAEKATIALTPIFFKAAMLALDGTSVGNKSCFCPCLAKNATGNPPSVTEIVIGDDGYPHGVETVNLATGFKFGKSYNPVPPMIANWTGSLNS
mmetsp:Transcript_394/g.452  ORF Transcript_394/g.452 Transcript_394/m.452 type:complete len:208 (+) Transcript_394:521-1144(+)